MSVLCRTASDEAMLHQCSPHFLTAPLISQRRSREQMPNNTKFVAPDGRMSMDALNAVLENTGIEYRDLNDRTRKKVLMLAGVYGLPNLKRGPKGCEKNSDK